MKKISILLLVLCMLFGCKHRNSLLVSNDKELLDFCEAAMLLIFDLKNVETDKKYTKLRNEKLKFLDFYKNQEAIAEKLLIMAHTEQKKITNESEEIVKKRVKSTIFELENLFISQIKEIELFSKNKEKEYEDYVTYLFVKHKPLYDLLDKS